MFGEDGLRELQRIQQGLPADAPAERSMLLLEYIQTAKRAAPQALQGLDPFEQPPRGTRPNCGPDERKRFAVKLSSREDLADFLRTRARWVNAHMEFDAFRDAKGSVDWARLAASATVSTLGRRTVYALRFVPKGCAGFDFRMTSDGFTSVYGCCGK